MQRALGGIIEGDNPPLAHVSLLAKDIALALDAARSVQPINKTDYGGPLGAHAGRFFAQAIAAGLAKDDDSALVRWLQTTPTRN